MNELNELKPCPFCGNKKDFDVRTWANRLYAVRCLHCDAMGTPSAYPNQAKDAWNKREGK